MERSEADSSSSLFSSPPLRRRCPPFFPLLLLLGTAGLGNDTAVKFRYMAPNQFSDAPGFGFCKETSAVGRAPIATRILSREEKISAAISSRPCSFCVCREMRQCPVANVEIAQLRRIAESTHLRPLSETNLCSSRLIVKFGQHSCRSPRSGASPHPHEFFLSAREEPC